MGLAWLVALPRESRAQIPFIGLVARDDCTAAAQLPEANLFAFRLTQGRFDQAPDVLFDETPTGGAQTGGASAPTASGALWSIPPNWQSFQRFGDHVVAIVLNEGTLHFDSGPVTTQDMAACLAQQLCSHPNAMGPLVRTSGGDRVDVMKPVIGSATIRLTWLPLAPTRAGAVFDVLSGCLCRRRTSPQPNAPGCLWQDRSRIAAACLADDQIAVSLSDARAIDPDMMGFYYLVREQSACGTAGNYGRDSLGNEPIIGAADCLP